MSELTPSYSGNGVQIFTGDCREVLPLLPEKSVNCCVTSPPYWGLRDYGTAKWEGGNPECQHEAVGTTRTPWANAVKGPAGVNGKNGSEYAQMTKEVGGSCAKCGAIRVDNQIGLEATPSAYVETMVGLFREVRRVLADDGTVWLNLGDSYCNAGTRNNGTGLGDDRRGGMKDTDGTWESSKAAYGDIRKGFPDIGVKKKDLVGIPWRVALALQADGWYLRSDIIWNKPNVMPESVTDRPTKSHEYIFLLSKSDRYFYDSDAIREESANVGRTKGLVRNQREGASSARTSDGRRLTSGTGQRTTENGSVPSYGSPEEGKNARSVWTINTRSYSGAHFATFPPELPTRCISAGCPAGGTVLDPFHGAGTTGMVAESLGRKYVGIELNPEYVNLSKKRVGQETIQF